jgi:exonuclease VII large subunit
MIASDKNLDNLIKGSGNNIDKIGQHATNLIELLRKTMEQFRELYKEMEREIEETLDKSPQTFNIYEIYEKYLSSDNVKKALDNIANQYIQLYEKVKETYGNNTYDVEKKYLGPEWSKILTDFFELDNYIGKIRNNYIDRDSKLRYLQKAINVLNKIISSY